MGPTCLVYTGIKGKSEGGGGGGASHPSPDFKQEKNNSRKKLRMGDKGTEISDFKKKLTFFAPSTRVEI